MKSILGNMMTNPKMAAVSRTTTNDAQCCLIHGHSIPRAFFIKTGTVTVTRRPPVPNMQETLCQEDMKDKTCMHIIDVPENPDDAGMHADNTCQPATYETYQEEAIDKTCLEKTAMPRNITNGGPPNNDVLSQTGTVDAARGPAVPDATSEKGKHDVPETLRQGLMWRK